MLLPLPVGLVTLFGGGLWRGTGRSGFQRGRLGRRQRARQVRDLVALGLELLLELLHLPRQLLQPPLLGGIGALGLRRLGSARRLWQHSSALILQRTTDRQIARVRVLPERRLVQGQPCHNNYHTDRTHGIRDVSHHVVGLPYPSRRSRGAALPADSLLVLVDLVRHDMAKAIRVFSRNATTDAVIATTDGGESAERQGLGDRADAGALA